jgi:hypothetical protein
MSRYRTGTAVKLREPLRRSSWHKHGPVRVRRGARGEVLKTKRHWRKGRRYDVTFRRRRKAPKVVKSIPATKVQRRLTKVELQLLLVTALTLFAFAAQRFW